MNLKNIIALKQFDEDHKGGVINSRTLLEQIGRMNWLAISGGRYEVFNSTVFLPVAKGYWVAITLTGADDYTVNRITLRAGKVTVKETFEGVYAENIGEVAYRASCFENAA
jgi:hypothetical protein